ncbi:MAG TPA: FtsQ-type POTRA domain-containing protein [Vicinamibacterales bacterium]
MSPVAAPADKRFRRAHVKPGRRRHSWKAYVKPTVRFACIGLVVVFGAYHLNGIVAHAHMLRVEKISIRGNERLSRDEVMQTLQGMVGESLIWTDLDKWRQRLMKSSWVRDVAMRRSLPSTIDIVIAERVPVAIARARENELYLMDERGVLIDRDGPQYVKFDLPMVDGLSVKWTNEGPVADEDRAELAARVIAALKTKPQLGGRLQQLDVSDEHNAAIILNDDPIVIQLGDDQFVQRLESYLGLAAALRERVADIDYVDLRFDDRIYVRPAGKKAK